MMFFWITFALISATLALLAYKDIRYYILPDILNLNLFILLITLNFLSDWQLMDIEYAILGSLLGGGMMLSIKLIADKFYKPDSLGLGDVKLITAAGIGLGFPNIFIMLSLGSLIGILHAFTIAYKNKINITEAQTPAGFGFTIAIFIIITLQILTMLNMF